MIASRSSVAKIEGVGIPWSKLMPEKNIFISMGTPYNSAHTKCRESLIELLRDCGVTPRLIDVTDYSTSKPLTDIYQLLRQCDGAIIVAYERTFVDSGFEKRKSPAEKPLSAVRYTTPWNQIEAAFAHSFGIPILVLMENGLKEEGLLDEKFDWYVERLEISAKTFSNKDVRARILAWCRKIQADKKKRDGLLMIDAPHMTVSDALKFMTLRTGAYLALFIIFVFSSGMAAYPIVDKIRATFGL
jgi:hypothetical protein